MQEPPRILVADVGGTNTRVGLARGHEVDPASVRRYRNAEHRGLADILTAYLAETPAPGPDAACVAAAGPLEGDRLRMTNLDWEITPDLLAEAAAVETGLVINDLQAQGHALAHLPPTSLPMLFGDDPVSGESGDALVVGLGTGVNIAPVHRLDHGVLVPPAEAGHADLPTPDAESFALARHLARRTGSASVEEALSGRGLEQIYQWLHSGGAQDAPARDGREAVRAAEIVAAHGRGDDPLATRTLQIHARLLGHVLADLALIFLPLAGIALAGGVARALGPHLPGLGLAEAFRDKGRFSGYMSRFRLCLIDDDYAALVGAAAAMTQKLR